MNSTALDQERGAESDTDAAPAAEAAAKAPAGLSLGGGRMPACRIVVFAKAPEPGYAKTRLAPLLGDLGAARLAAFLLRRAVRQAVGAAVGTVELCCAPDPGHPAFQTMQRRFGLALTAQGEGDLGARMSNAVERVVSAGAAVIVIGTDAPGLDAAYLQQAWDVLQRHDVVLGPAEDGGYTLIGLHRATPTLFEGLAWSTPAVWAQTQARVRRAGLTQARLGVLRDIDHPEDLRVLPPALRRRVERWSEARAGASEGNESRRRPDQAPKNTAHSLATGCQDQASRPVGE
jgi:rSAM/selenodomain-associated transferase 1